MFKRILIFFFFVLISNSKAEIKEKIIENLQNVQNLKFKFEQNINGKIENGICTIKYPKKIFCSYNMTNKKILVSNGKSLVIKTSNSYYIYPIERTPLNFILNKKFMINKITTLKERIIDDKFINFHFSENENEINLFFDKKTYNLIGWQTLDIYQNLSITYLNSIIKNQKLEKKIFNLPVRD